MAASKLYQAIIRAATSGDVHRALAEALFTLVIVAAKRLTERDDEQL